MGFPSLTTLIDNFNRTGPGIGSNWTIPTGASAIQITSNQCSAAATTALGLWNPATFGADTDAYMTVSTLPVSGQGASVMARCKDISSGGTIDGYFVTYQHGTGILVRRLDNGSATTLASDSTTLVAGQKLGIRCIGSSIQAWYTVSGTWTAGPSATDSTYSAAGNIGIFLSGTTSRVDDFSGGTYVPFKSAWAVYSTVTLGAGTV